MNLEKLLDELRFSNVVRGAVRKRIAGNEKQMCDISEKSYDSEGLDFPLCEYESLTRLAAITNLLLQKYGEYRSKGISERVVFDTFRDISLRAEFFYKKTGRIGISKADVIWFRHIMNINIFKLGVLQYQPFQMLYLDEKIMGEPYMTFPQIQRNILLEGAPVINCHIQWGTDLRAKAVGYSLKEAEYFFAEYFPDVRFRGFLCYSWLLYPPMTKALPKESNIRRFAGRFSVIGTCADAEQAMESLFEGGKILYREATSLQKMAMENPELLGYACGFRSML